MYRQPYMLDSSFVLISNFEIHKLLNAGLVLLSLLKNRNFEIKQPEIVWYHNSIFFYKH